MKEHSLKLSWPVSAWRIVKSVILWVVQILLAPFNVLAASGKLMSRPQVIEELGTGGFVSSFINLVSVVLFASAPPL
jgi:hypothetical protein